jgi:hypothetical protein
MQRNIILSTPLFCLPHPLKGLSSALPTNINNMPYSSTRRMHAELQAVIRSVKVICAILPRSLSFPFAHPNVEGASIGQLYAPMRPWTGGPQTYLA